MQNKSHRFILKSALGWIDLHERDGQLISIGWRAKALAKMNRTSGILARTAVELQEYFAGERQVFSVQPSIGGNTFREQVWRELLRIPYGETATYGEIARRIGSPKAARAVGQACHHNPWLILVPCHRVVAANGGLGGYALNLEVKRQLLSHEGAQKLVLNTESSLAESR